MKPDHDPQEVPTMRHLRRARQEVLATSRARARPPSSGSSKPPWPANTTSPSATHPPARRVSGPRPENPGPRPLGRRPDHSLVNRAMLLTQFLLLFAPTLRGILAHLPHRPALNPPLP